MGAAHPGSPAGSALVGELTVRSEEFRRRWAISTTPRRWATTRRTKVTTDRGNRADLVMRNDRGTNWGSLFTVPSEVVARVGVLMRWFSIVGVRGAQVARAMLSLVLALLVRLVVGPSSCLVAPARGSVHLFRARMRSHPGGRIVRLADILTRVTGAEEARRIAEASPAERG
ncbi:MAG TPA: hypothetical protein VGP05_17105 [Pseudonocardia sp.]|nr:hypothetical protein [Pseudonocardia sp.]